MYQYKPPAPLCSIPGLASNTHPQQFATWILKTTQKRKRAYAPASYSQHQPHSVKYPLKKNPETIMYAFLKKKKYKNRHRLTHMKYTHMHKTRKSHSFTQTFNPAGSQLLSKVNKLKSCSMIRSTQSSPEQNITTALMINQTTRNKERKDDKEEFQVGRLFYWKSKTKEGLSFKCQGTLGGW